MEVLNEYWVTDIVEVMKVDEGSGLRRKNGGNGRTVLGRGALRQKECVLDLGIE
jgi:hypothetical protein